MTKSRWDKLKVGDIVVGEGGSGRKWVVAGLEKSKDAVVGAQLISYTHASDYKYWNVVKKEVKEKIDSL